MEKNYLSSVVWIVLASVLALLGLFWVSGINIGTWSMRKVDVLSDLRNDSILNSLVENDSLAAQIVKRDPQLMAILEDLSEKHPVLEGSHMTHDRYGNIVTYEDSIIVEQAAKTVHRDGVTNITDMSNGESGGMASFYQALSQAGNRPVRIAVLGDSFIEGDILTSMLRELLQQRFGGQGAGYLPMTSITAKVRLTVKQTFEGWNQYLAVHRSNYNNNFNNISGNYFTASDGAWVNLQGNGNHYPHSATCSSSSFYFFNNGGSCYATAVINGRDTTRFHLNSSTTIGHATVTGNIKTVQWRVSNPDNMVFLGTSMDCDRGVIVDNFAMRSARGTHLSKVSPSILSSFNQARQYDLVILMYGLNIVEHNKKAYTAYSNTLISAINNIKANMPGTSILVVGCSDREKRTAKGWKTMEGVLGLIQAQKHAAIETKVAFWDLYHAMGGEGSIVKMVKQGEASSDYTHINGKGGNRIARLLYDALILGYETR